MRSIFEKNNIRWVKINEPTGEDFEYVKNAFPFHPLVIESIITPTLHPAIEEYEDHLFLILHFPVIYHDTAKNVVAEIDFLITKDTLITITYRDYPKLNEFFEKISNGMKIQEKIFNKNTGELLYSIIDWLFASLIQDLDFLEEAVTDIEDKIFAAHRNGIVEEISHARRDILDFRRITSPLQTVLKLLPSVVGKFYGKQIEPYFTDLLASESKVRHFIENHKDTIEALHATSESLISNRVSKIITLLTIFSTIILPLNFIASIWGMNHQFLPLRDGQYDFWIVAGAMAAIAIALVIYFRRKRWL